MASRIPMQHILCPTDYSEHSRQALERAIDLAAWFRARLTVLHVIGIAPPGLPDVGAIGLAAISEDLARAWEAEESLRLERFVEPYLGAGVPIATKAVQGESGDCWRGIQAEAEALPADLVVMGTHGRTGLDHVRLGSVAEKLLRVAPCPVLTVRAQGEAPDREPLFRRIVCATDLATPSHPTVDLALSLAGENLARVTLLYVIEELGAESGPDVGRPFPAAGAPPQTLMRLARERLHELARPARTFCDVDERVERGRAWKQILRVAREAHADLIVVGAHTGGAFGRFLLGSNANQVVRHAPCPVLVVRDALASADQPLLAATGASGRAPAAPGR
jgi:nucleotide-binding universal stress UspA family protein